LLKPSTSFLTMFGVALAAKQKSDIAGNVLGGGSDQQDAVPSPWNVNF